MNVMVFHQPNEGSAWFPHIQFLEQGVALENLLGLLALHTPFSAQKSGAAASVSPDPTMRPFALPVPVDPGKPKEGGGDGWRVLPGGPRAFVHRSFEHFSPATELANWCETHGDFKRGARVQPRC